MIASIKSWLMIGGLVVVVALGFYATKQLDGQRAPPAEITPGTLSSNNSPERQSRTHFPTILRAKPVTEAASTFSPRYAPRDATLPRDSRLPVDDLQSNTVSAERRPIPTDPPSTTSPATPRPVDSDGVSPSGANPQAPGAVSPAFRAPAAVNEPSSLPNVSNLESPDDGAAETPTTYVTMAQDSFWNISKLRYGGEGRYFKALYFHNRKRVERPDQIPAGIEIETPSLAELERLYPDLCRRR